MSDSKKETKANMNNSQTESTPDKKSINASNGTPDRDRVAQSTSSKSTTITSINSLLDNLSENLEKKVNIKSTEKQANEKEEKANEISATGNNKDEEEPNAGMFYKRNLPQLYAVLFYKLIRLFRRSFLFAKIQERASADASLLKKLLRSRLMESESNIEIERKNPDSPLYSVKRFEDLNLKPELLQGLYGMGFTKPSKIQETALPALLNDPPQNLIAQSQSGTGKTAAFALAMLSRIDTNLNYPQASQLYGYTNRYRQI
jgi:ATP-dependent helicase YprA (DUF1998 family)